MASRKGELRVKVISAKGLRDTAIFGIQDPYVQVTCRQFSVIGGADDSIAVQWLSGTRCIMHCVLLQLEYGSLKVKTAVHRDGGTSPVWNESIKL